MRDNWCRFWTLGTFVFAVVIFYQQYRFNESQNEINDLLIKGRQLMHKRVEMLEIKNDHKLVILDVAEPLNMWGERW